MSEPGNSRFSSATVTQALLRKLTGRHIEIKELEPVVVEIHVSGEFEHELDASVAGVYLMEVDPGLPEDEIAGTALDAFHSAVEIRCMDTFQYAVLMNGVRLQKASNHVDDEFTRGAFMVCKVSG